MDNLAYARGARVEDVVETLVEQLRRFAGSTADNWIAILEEGKSFSGRGKLELCKRYTSREHCDLIKTICKPPPDPKYFQSVRFGHS